MTTNIMRASKGAARWLGSTTAWRWVLCLFFVESLWLAFSAQYPMAFDENYHFGLIKLHAQQWLPFFTHQPQNAAIYGAIVRDPSYLYHWLMSFPYRLIAAMTANLAAQVIFLRLINVALFGLGLVLYHRIIRRLGVSAALTTSLFAVFVLIPVVPFLAAHINYDNLFFVAIAITILLAFRFIDTMRTQKSIDAGTLALLIITLCLSSLVKYPYLPIALVTGVLMLWHAWRTRLLNMDGLRTLSASFMKLQTVKRLLLVLLVLVSLGLFSERYIVNVVTYHTPVPACDAVITLDECVQYGPYGRDHAYEQQKPPTFHPSFLGYIWDWCFGMWYRLFFAINYDYTTAPPLELLGVVSVAAAALLFVGIVAKAKFLFGSDPARQFVGLLIVGYVIMLFADGFSAYVKTAQPVAINGRYLIPFMPFVFALGGLAWSRILEGWQYIKVTWAAAVIAVFLLQGGGAMTFIVRSADTWMWNNGTVRSLNRAVRSTVWPFIIGKGNY